MVLFPITSPTPKREQEFLQALLTRGFSRIKVGEEVLDLREAGAHSLARNRPVLVVLDRLLIRSDDRPRLVEAIETAFREAEGQCLVDVIGQGTHTYSTQFRCQRCGRTFEPLRPILFSFNHPLGACSDCKGFGNILRYDPTLVIRDQGKSLAQGAIEPWSKSGTDWWRKQMLLAMKRQGIDITTPFKDLPESVQRKLWEGDDSFEGINDFFEYMEGKRYKLHVRVLLSRYRTPYNCPTCGGSRLKPDARYVKIAGRDIHDLSDLTIDAAASWIE